MKNWFETLINRGHTTKGPLNYFMKVWNLEYLIKDITFFETHTSQSTDEIIDLGIEKLEETIEYLKMLKSTTTPEEREKFIKKLKKDWKKYDEK